MKRAYRILICAAACAAAAALPAFGLEPLLPPVIALAGLMAAEWGFAYMMPVLIGGAVGFCVLQQWAASGSLFLSTPAEYCLVITFVLTTVFAGIAMRYKLKNRWTMLAYTVILCIGIYLSLTADSILSGKPPYSGVVDSLTAMDDELAAVLGDSYTADTRARTAAAISSIPDLLMMFSLILAELSALFVFVSGRFFYRKFKAEPTKMADFTLWRLPSSILWGFLITAAVCAAAFLFNLSIAASLAFTMGFAFLSLFAVQGFSFLSFIFARTNSPKMMRVLTVLVILLLMPYSLGFLAMIGIYEQIGKKRLLIAAYERQMSYERRLMKRRDDYEKYGYSIDDLTAKKPKPESKPEDGSGEGEDNDRKRGL